jgi:hypothetical protein
MFRGKGEKGLFRIEVKKAKNLEVKSITDSPIFTGEIDKISNLIGQMQNLGIIDKNYLITYKHIKSID